MLQSQVLKDNLGFADMPCADNNEHLFSAPKLKDF